MQADEDQLALLKKLLHSITLSSGLVVNFHKSCLVPINVSLEKLAPWPKLLAVRWALFLLPFLDYLWV
jgi:hypothetical protein